jgi:L-seryl-tRNA(Ser) seleniumtransferase
MTGEGVSTLAGLPAVHEVLEHPGLAAQRATLDHALLVAEIQAHLAAHRQALRSGAYRTPPTAAELVEEVVAAVAAWRAPRLKPVINLTGTLLHTNLGRAPLSQAAIDALVRAAGTVNLEFDLEAGRRGDRDSLLEGLLRRLTGAEAATVVNNNAAAVHLALNTLANRRRVAVSRGELVEIGDSFRMPDIIRASGCRLMEVGTTNRTHLRDYEQALAEGAALLLKVHPSNYCVEGFTHEVALAELVELGRRHRVPVVVDLGSGALADPRQFGIEGEPTVQAALRDGADVVTFSGDKLLGGPQAGIALGTSELIRRMKRNPMKRVLRCDKLRLAALEATLEAYLAPRTLAQSLPAYRMISRPLAEIEQLAHELLPHVAHWARGRAQVTVISGQSQVGSGSAPQATFATRLIALRPALGGPEQLARELRALDPPIVGRVHDGAVLLDLRALLDPDQLIAALTASPHPTP